MKNMAYEIGKSLVIGVYNADQPTDEEWNEYLEALRRFPDHGPVLSCTDGGSPNTMQRQRMMAVYSKEQSTKIRVAVVTDAIAVYGVIVAISWFNSNTKGFKTAKLDEALTYLGVPAAQFSVVKMRIRALRREIGL